MIKDWIDSGEFMGEMTFEGWVGEWGFISRLTMAQNKRFGPWMGQGAAWVAGSGPSG